MKLGIDIEPSQWSEPFLEVVFSCGLDIVDKQKAEVLVKDASKITQTDLEGGQKIIALEKTSGGNIAFRQILKHPSVIRYVKSFNYKSFELHNLPCVDGRLFTASLSHNVDLQYPEAFINMEEYNKIVLGWSILHYFRLRRTLSLPTEELLRKDTDRPIDVFFAGTLDYNNSEGKRKSGDIISDHRKKCIEVLESIKGYKIVIVKGKLLNLADYNQMLYQSKVIISPWGWGEPCYRDYEAILAGCILVKPLTDFVKSACGIFEHSYCMWTQPDFSKLGDDIDTALRKFESTQSNRMISREAIVNSAKQLPSIIKMNLTV